MKPPQHEIDWALSIEKRVSEPQRSLYLECMNNKPMSERKTDRELRDGCILTGVYIQCSNDK